MCLSALGFSEYLALVGQNFVDVVFQVVLMHQVFDLCQVPIGIVCDSCSWWGQEYKKKNLMNET